jgi:hypothetical protein
VKDQNTVGPKKSGCRACYDRKDRAKEQNQYHDRSFACPGLIIQGRGQKSRKRLESLGLLLYEVPATWQALPAGSPGYLATRFDPTPRRTQFIRRQRRCRSLGRLGCLAGKNRADTNATVQVSSTRKFDYRASGQKRRDDRHSRPNIRRPGRFAGDAGHLVALAGRIEARFCRRRSPLMPPWELPYRKERWRTYSRRAALSLRQTVFKRHPVGALIPELASGGTP